MMLFLFLGTFFAHAQPEITVTAPSANGATSGLRAPNGTTTHTTFRGVIIIPASELTAIPSGTTITKLSLLISTAGSAPAGGTMQYYLENTADVTNLKSTDWATLIAPMTSVYNGPFNIPAAVGPTGDLTLSTGFVYTGGSLYVAYDYLGTTFAATGCIYSANSSLAGGWKGLGTATTTPAATLTGTSAFRPSFRFTFANPFTNELNVAGLAGEKGIFNNTIKTTQTVTSFISNTSQGDLTNIPVTLNITGANPYTLTQTIPTIVAGATSTLLFNNVPTSVLGAQTLTITIPSDQNNTNNSRTFLQQVQCDTISYVQFPTQSAGVGFNTGTGLIGVRHDIPNNITTFVKGVSNYFPTAATNSGNTVKGVLLNASGVILDSTAVITITAGMLGTKQDFNFINGTIDVSGETIYVGFRQTANATTGYFPFGNQNNSYVDPNAAATFPVFGGTAAPLGSSLGYMMIGAVLTYGGFDVANSSNAGTVCENSPLTISPMTGYSNYDFFVNGSSVQNAATSTYTTAPLTTGITYNVNITNGICALNSNVQTINVTPTTTSNIAAAICLGQSYTFGTQTLTSGGTYTNTLTSAAGCDSVVTLNLTIKNSSTGVDIQTVCGSYTWIDNVTYTTSNSTATYTLTNAVGCDSVVTLNLTINNPNTGTDVQTACDSYTWINNVTYTASNNTATQTLTNALGCDSVVTLNLTINTVDTSVTDMGMSLMANATGATYQWVDCNNANAPIAGETNQTFTPVGNGDYAVEVTANGCTSMSSCYNVTGVFVQNLNANTIVNLYPNPTENQLMVDFGTVMQDATVRIFALDGRILQEHNAVNGKQFNISLKDYPTAMYFLEVLSKDGQSTMLKVSKL